MLKKHIIILIASSMLPLSFFIMACKIFLTPDGDFLHIFSDYFWSNWLMFFSVVLMYFVIDFVSKDIKNISFASPKEELFLINYSGYKLDVIISQRISDKEEKGITVFFCKEKNIPLQLIYCYTPIIFQKDEVVELKYIKELNQLGYYNDRQMLHTTSF